MPRTLRSMRTATTVLVVAALALIWASASGTLGGFSTASLGNAGDTARTGTLSFTHNQGSCSGSAMTSPVSCSTSVLPPTSSGTVSDTITDTGSVTPSTAQVRMVGCAPVDLTNSAPAPRSGAMLPRAGVTFNPGATDGPANSTGYLSFASTSYASSITQATEPSGSGVGAGKTLAYNLGVWFKTSSKAGGALFGFGSSPLDVSGTNNRMLYLDGSGNISFIVTSATSTPAGTAPGASAYNDGKWHFADVTMSVSNFAGIIGWTTTVYVDSRQAGQTIGLGPLPAVSGYWHLGWSPVPALSNDYFQGSLADFAVNDSGSATQLSTSVGAASSQSDFWALDDSGGSLSGATLTGTLPPSTSLPTSSTPCSDVTLTWTLTNPVATVASAKTLTAFAGTSYTPIGGGPAPGATQSSTMALARANPTDTYATGLILYTPVQFDFSRGSWDDLFSYASPAAGASAGSTITVSAS